MDSLTLALLNWPLAILNIVANVIYIICFVCPLNGERIKQPLKLLLGTLIYSTVVYLLSCVTLFHSMSTTNNLELLLVSYVAFGGSLSTNMTSSVWLNFFYYTQIVPAQRAVFIWIKKNIKIVIYCIWLVERVITLNDSFVVVTSFLTNPRLDGFNQNFTEYHGTAYFPIQSGELWMTVFEIAVYIQRTHCFVSLCIMVMSSGAIVVYLCRHMRRMVANGQPFSCPRFCRQVRVTIACFVQGTLYTICAVWSTNRLLSPHNFPQFSHTNIEFTVIHFYMAGTTLNVGTGQAVFRQRAAAIWTRAAQWCRAWKVEQSKQGA